MSDDLERTAAAFTHNKKIIKWNFKQVIKATNSMPTIFRGSKVFSYSVKAKEKSFRPKSRKKLKPCI